MTISKRVLLVAALLTGIFNMSEAQNVSLSFTGVLSVGGYVRMDSVRVESPARSWSETLIYPDTVLSFGTTAIDEAESEKPSIKCYPNPFRGFTTVAIYLPEGGQVALRVYDLSGRGLLEKSFDANAGGNAFRLSLKEKTACVLVAETPFGTRTTKLLSTGGAANNGIEKVSLPTAAEKLLTYNPFQLGDTLIVKGFATRRDSSFTSVVKTLVPTASGLDSLLFIDTVLCQGALPGLFSVGPNKRVRFSRGNLQWCSTGDTTVPTYHLVILDDSTIGNIGEGTWRFALHQYDITGDSNYRNRPYHSGWTDRYAWATSGYHDANDTNNENYQPYSYYDGFQDMGGGVWYCCYCLSYYSQNASYNCYGFGPSLYMQDLDLARTSAYYDWGVFNAISNGGNRPGLWRTLDSTEWRYLFHDRPNAVYKYGLAMIDTIRAGLVVLPDNWVLPAGITFVPGLRSFGTNVYTKPQWEQMQKAGAVFLPEIYNYVTSACGMSSSDTIINTWLGYYWTVNNYSTQYAATLSFFRNHLYPGRIAHKNEKYSVRLVQDY